MPARPRPPKPAPPNHEHDMLHEIVRYLDALNKKLDHLHQMQHASAEAQHAQGHLLEHVADAVSKIPGGTVDPAKLQGLTEKLKASNAALKAKVDANQPVQPA